LLRRSKGKAKPKSLKEPRQKNALNNVLLRSKPKVEKPKLLTEGQRLCFVEAKVKGLKQLFIAMNL